MYIVADASKHHLKVDTMRLRDEYRAYVILVNDRRMMKLPRLHI